MSIPQVSVNTSSDAIKSPGSGRRCCRGAWRLLHVEGDSLGFELRRGRSTIALPDVAGGATRVSDLHPALRTDLRPRGVQGDDRLETCAGPTPHLTKTCSAAASSGVPRLCPITRQSIADWSSPSRASTAVPRGIDVGRRHPPCRRRLIPRPMSWTPSGAHRSTSRTASERREHDSVVDVDRPDVRDQQSLCSGDRPSRREHPNPAAAGRVPPGSVGLGGEPRSTGEPGDGDRGDGGGDQGFAHGPDRSPSPPLADGTWQISVRRLSAADSQSVPNNLCPVNSESDPLDSSSAEETSAAYRDDRAHVFHSWSAQALIKPLAVAGASG